MSRTYLNYQVSLCEFLISKCQGSSSMTKYSVSFPNSYCCNLMFCSIWELSSKQMWFTYFVMCCGTLSHSPDIRGAWNRTLLQPGSTNRPLSNPMQKHMKYVITVFFFLLVSSIFEIPYPLVFVSLVLWRIWWETFVELEMMFLNNSIIFGHSCALFCYAITSTPLPLSCFRCVNHLSACN